MKIITPQEGYLRASTLCSRGEQCSGDILTKLKNWGITEDEAHKIVTRLIEERFIDNRRFARAYCRDKARFQGWGKRKIMYNLRQKGVEQDIIAESLEQVEEGIYSERLLTILKNKAKSLASKDPYKARAALFRHAISRGFETQEITAALKQINDLPDEDCEY